MFRDTLGLPVAAGSAEPAYFTTSKVEGIKNFGMWPLYRAAMSCFGKPEWPADLPAPRQLRSEGSRSPRSALHPGLGSASRSGPRVSAGPPRAGDIPSLSLFASPLQCRRRQTRSRHWAPAPRLRPDVSFPPSSCKLLHVRFPGRVWRYPASQSAPPRRDQASNSIPLGSFQPFASRVGFAGGRTAASMIEAMTSPARKAPRLRVLRQLYATRAVRAFGPSRRFSFPEA